ncbi:hypothetical protein FRC07_008002 [Ceratobasidium sp. 392]|nr:hypothetical protein FRC07_008002 [Ceratobasidium sp. 392]
MSQSHTPPKAHISGQLSASGTILSETPLLKDELKGRLSQISFTDFRFAFLHREHDDVSMTSRLDQAASEFQSSDSFCIPYRLFSDATSSNESSRIYAPLVELMNNIVNFTQINHAAPDALPLVFTDKFSIAPVPGSDRQRKPDIVGVHSSQPTLGKPSWNTLSVVCEYKKAAPPTRRNPSSLPTSQSAARSRSRSQHDSGLQIPPSSGVSQRSATETDLQLSRYLLEMRAAQPTRAAGYGIQFMRDQASFWYSDADSTIASAPVPINSPGFIGAIMSMARATGEGLGYTPDFLDAAGGLSTQAVGAQLVLDGTTYIIVRVVSHARAMHGRCTCALEGKNPSGEHYAIKLSWQVTTRVSEVEMINLAHERDVSNIVEVIYSTDLRILSHGRRSRLPPDVQRTVQLEDRCLRVLVLPLYMPLYKVQQPDHFLKACISLLNAIHELYHKGKILHRDVSVTNLMVRINEPWIGVLIDLDLAHEEKPVDVNNLGPTSLYRTGTLPFMALDLLHDKDEYSHYHRHDLESFVYVIAWIAGRYDNGIEVKPDRFSAWYKGHWSTIRKEKVAFLAFDHDYTRCVNTSYKFLERTLNRIRECLGEAHTTFRKMSIIMPERLFQDVGTVQGDLYFDDNHQSVSTGLKRKRDPNEETVVEEELPYPKDLPPFGYQALFSLLNDALVVLIAPPTLPTTSS